MKYELSWRQHNTILAQPMKVTLTMLL